VVGVSAIGTHTVSKRRESNSYRLAVAGEAFEHLDVSAGDRIKVLDAGDSVLLVPASHTAGATVLAEYGVYDCGDILQTTLFTPALEPLGVRDGDKVEVRPRPVGVGLVRGETA
jgi:hypothetical protein